jgi:uncharacterized membrane protein
MVGKAAAALEVTTFAEALRGSTWVYPLVNAAHILGVAMLVGGTVPIALRLAGAWRSVTDPPLPRVLACTACAGFLLAVACGILLFVARATRYAQSGLFVLKMAVLAAGIADSLVLLRATTGGRLQTNASARRLPARIRISAILALLLWPTVLVLGRLVGYF